MSRSQLATLAGHGSAPLHLATRTGDVVLFDSRCAHAGRSAKVALPGDRRGYRLATYVCAWPATRLDARHRAAKKAALEKVLTLTHWPDGRLEHWRGRNCAAAKGVQEAPGWVTQDRAMLQLAGAVPYDG